MQDLFFKLPDKPYMVKKWWWSPIISPNHHSFHSEKGEKGTEMKFQCDVCTKKEASFIVYTVADICHICQIFPFIS